VVATACGKVILLGEHAVVYGEPALAVPLPDLRLVVVLSDGLPLGHEPDPTPSAPWNDATDTVVVAALRRAREDGQREPVPPLVLDLEADAPPSARGDVVRALAAAAGALGLPVPLPLRVAVRSGGLSSGLGTSAALGVALVRGLSRWFGTEPDASRVREAAMAVESLFHGNPSGVDVAVSALEGPLWFSKKEAPRLLTGLPPIHLLLRRRRAEQATRVLVEGVRHRLAEDPSLARTIAELGRRSRAGRSAWEQGDQDGLAAAMQAQQRGLSRLGVVAPADEEAVDLALRAGARAAKITGAGGGGAVLALVDPGSEAKVKAAWGEDTVAFVVQPPSSELG
jgi:mevalonate kinase